MLAPIGHRRLRSCGQSFRRCGPGTGRGWRQGELASFCDWVDDGFDIGARDLGGRRVSKGGCIAFEHALDLTGRAQALASALGDVVVDEGREATSGSLLDSLRLTHADYIFAPVDTPAQLQRYLLGVVQADQRELANAELARGALAPIG